MNNTKEFKLYERVRYQVVVAATTATPLHLEDREGTIVNFDTCPYTKLPRAVISTPGELANRSIRLSRLSKIKVNTMKFDEKIGMECLEKAGKWLETTSMWADCGFQAKTAVAEYIANQMGYTIYEHLAEPNEEETVLDVKDCKECNKTLTQYFLDGGQCAVCGYKYNK